MKITRSISVSFQREGIHRYPAAGTDPNLADVSFLAFPHRHIFHFDAMIDVMHNDRDIEFIQFKRWLESMYTDNVLDLDYKSCEMLAEELLRAINDRYPDRYISVEVSEDGENGAFLRYDPEDQDDA
jgi:hypothetical protein